MLKLGFFVPLEQLETVKEALFEAGAGRMGDYEACCWQTAGTGQFRPGPGANPFIGKAGKLETVEEYRVEMVLEDALARPVLAALRRAHPYEEPAFDLVRLVEESEFGDP